MGEGVEQTPACTYLLLCGECMKRTFGFSTGSSNKNKMLKPNVVETCILILVPR